MTKRRKYKRVRQSDIADSLGISTVTVSNALAGRKGVSDALRRKILAQAELMGYGREADMPPRRTAPSPSQLARQTYRIAVCFAPDYSTEARLAFTDILAAWPPTSAMPVDEIFLINIDELGYADSVETFIREAREQEAEAVMTIGVFSEDFLHDVNEALDLPWLSMDGALIFHRADAFRSDAFRAGYVLTHALLAKGHRRIGVLVDPPVDGLALDLYQGYAKAHLEKEEPYSKDLAFFLKPIAVKEGFRREMPQIITHIPDALMLEPDPVTAWVLADYSMAHFLDQELARCGTAEVPDVAVLYSANMALEPQHHTRYRHVYAYVIDRIQMLKQAIMMLRRRIRSRNRPPQEMYFTGSFHDLHQKES